METSPRKSILILGYGVLGGRLLDDLSRTDLHLKIFVSGRDETELDKRINLTRYVAINYGFTPDITPVPLDILDVNSTSRAITEISPDIIFNSTSVIPWWVLDQIPKSLGEPLKQAGSGIWAATDLLLPMRLSEALKRANFAGIFLNASFPDLVNPMIFSPDIGPICGIGNVANAVPGLMLAAASLLNEDIQKIRVRFVAHHFLSYSMPVTGTSGGAPFCLQVLLNEKDVTERLDPELIFQEVATRHLRVKGLAGQGVTTSSAMNVLAALIRSGDHFCHAPGVHGQLGGYPVRATGGRIVFDLPANVSMSDAVRINLLGQRWDGIESVSKTGGISITARGAEIARQFLDYEPDVITLENCELKASELADKFEFARRQHEGAR